MYYIVYSLLYLVSLLPMRVLYFIADGLYGIAYYIIKYRREVVMNNLTIAFPEKTEAGKTTIAKAFYHNFIDTLVETIKMVSASDAFILKHFTGNWEVINEQYKTGRSCQVLLGHTFNWEYGHHALCKNTPYKFLGVYMPLSNKLLNRLFIHIRSRGGTVLLSAHNIRQDILPYLTTQYTIGLAADQSPRLPGKAFWVNFFGRPTPFVTGPEKAARADNIPVLFAYIEKPKRGYYNVVFSLGIENPASLPVGALTEQYAHYVESVIRIKPDMWLWSHKRWKHAWKEEYMPLWAGNEKPCIIPPVVMEMK